MQGLREHFRQHSNPPVFFVSAIVIVAFVLWGVFAAGNLGTVANGVFTWINTYFGWWYILAATFFVIAAFVLMFSRFGNIKLGPDDSQPEFSTWAWFTMLFTAGMGIGLVFYSVNEPATHFQSPEVLSAESDTSAAATEGLAYTIFHWGLHPWAIYIILGAALGYFAFRRGLPLKPASAFYPLIGDRVYGWTGHIIDILAVFGTMFGLATSLGLGAGQITTGLSQTFGSPDTTWMRVIIIGVLILIASVSVTLGIQKGIRRLSLFNMYAAIVLALVVLLVGPTLAMLNYMVGGLGAYIQNLPQFSSQVFQGGAAQSWQHDWTLFYWGWWISWSAFVGMFLARISYGVTLRKFVAGAMLAPLLFSTVWYGIFGGGGLSLILEGNQAIADADSTSALFVYLDALPIASIIATLLSLLGIIVVGVFFATSSDSGSLVVDILTNGGDPRPNVYQRLFWAVSVGAVAAILLIAGATLGDPEAALAPLQTASVAAGLPFSVVLVLACIGLFKGLSEEKAPESSPEPGQAATRTAGPATRTSGPPPHQVQQMSAEEPNERRNRRS